MQFITLLYFLAYVKSVVLPQQHYLDRAVIYDFKQGTTRNSSGDEIANVNFLYDDIVPAQ